jgi:geranylgeranyl diphosphate synthase type II
MTSGKSVPIAVDPEFLHKLGQKAEYINGQIKDLMNGLEIGLPMQEVIQYALEAPGKRIRSSMALWTCELLAGRSTPNADIAAVALEMVHTYSLIHDDLPAMDDDDLRRGRPTCHRAFDEAAAILAGDALQTLAFELLATRIEGADTAVALIRELAHAAGPAGMIAGQAADIKAENSSGDIELLQYIHTQKTAQMFRCGARLGAICGGANAEQLALLSDYGLKLGLGFQIADDILDVSASSAQLGKTAGKDLAAGKMTYPALMGIDRARDLAQELAQGALTALETFGQRAELLRQLALALLEREK